MKISAGLVGLPNVGKSTLFNALTKSSVPAENYPFCTIDPHVALTAVPDTRIEKLQKIFNPEKVISATVQFVDIAGLVAGAAAGDGLGNQFLSYIREVNLILHVLRCFEDPEIVRSEKRIDPISDYETIVTELALKDMESIEKRIQKIEQLMRAVQRDPKNRKDLEKEFELLIKLKKSLENPDPEKIRELIIVFGLKTVPVLCAKKFLIVVNIAEQQLSDKKYSENLHFKELVEKFGGNRVVPVSAKIEAELSQLSEKESREFMKELGIEKSGLAQVIEKTYENLGLITFFTCGPKEVHAWPIKGGITAREAAGEIHSDMERGFICAEIFSYQDIFKHRTVSKLKALGKVRTEGAGYIVKDGDIINIRFNV